MASIKPLESTLQLQMSVYFECLCMLADKHAFQLLRNGGWTCGGQNKQHWRRKACGSLLVFLFFVAHGLLPQLRQCVRVTLGDTDLMADVVCVLLAVRVMLLSASHDAFPWLLLVVDVWLLSCG